MARTAVDIVRAYGVDAWTQGRDDLIPQLCHDPIIRHDAGREVRLSHAEQRARMRHNYEELRPVFEDVVLAGDDEYVTLVWNVTGRDPTWKWCGIEVFRVVDGLIAEVWNSPYMDGRWGLSKSLTGAYAAGLPFPLALMRADLEVEGSKVAARLLVPADLQGLAVWLTQLFGEPVPERSGGMRRRRFAPGGVSVPMALAVADTSGPAIGLANIALPSLTIEWERSGLINAAFDLTADLAPPSDAAPAPTHTVRLSETFGSFEGAAASGRVVEAGVTVMADGTARGRVTLRSTGASITGSGKLAFGWRDRRRQLIFRGEAVMSQPAGAFEDGGETQANYQWEGSGFTVTICEPEADI